MLKNRIVNWVVAVAVLVAVTGGSGLVADQLGWAVTARAHACASSSSSGGGC